MKSLDEFGSLEELKQTITQLTQRYESLRQEERQGKLAEARKIIETYQLTAEELGFGSTPARQEAPPAKKMIKRADHEDIPLPPTKSPQKALW